LAFQSAKTRRVSWSYLSVAASDASSISSATAAAAAMRAAMEGPIDRRNHGMVGETEGYH
jgi:hypothetical protein